MSDDTILDHLRRIEAVLNGLFTRDRLDVLQVAWINTADQARIEALITPGGVAEERARQLEQLNLMAALVAADEQDLELERLLTEGDHEGALRHLRRLRDDSEKGE
jgi:hypothetical protein